MNTGRPPHEPTPALRRLVEHHAATGTLHRQIAKLLGLSLNTLKKHYREELDLGLARANAVVRWIAGDKIGAEFAEPISLQGLAS